MKNDLFEPPFTPHQILAAYRLGYFPMWSKRTGIHWHYPDPRAIIPIQRYHPSKSLRPVLSRGEFEVRINTSFEEVIGNCAKPRYKGDTIWISEEMLSAYIALHKMGYAHSVEAFRDDKLVGGLYGVCIGGVFFGESMFTLVSNASKVAFHFLVQILLKNGFQVLDTQYINDNVLRYGAIEIPRTEFLFKLNKAIDLDCTFSLEKI